jgi:quercetin dioxygenase-like cupin family protein
MKTSRRGLASAFGEAIAGLLMAGGRARANDSTTKANGLRIGRRVVTGFDKAGRSAIIDDGRAPEAAIYDVPGRVSGYHVWSVASVPADLSNSSDPMVHGYDRNEPPPGGVIARVTTWFPGSGYPMHTTETIDFGIVLSGRLELGLESGTTVLEPGDVVVQRNTPHSWRVIGDQPCTVAFVLVDGKNPTRKAYDPS